MRITHETRRESYGAIQTVAVRRRDYILKVLEGRELTATEIAEILLKMGLIPYYERNFAAPRLTELKQEGKVRTVGKRRCEKTGRAAAVWVRV